MSRITDIQEIVRNKQRKAIFVDGYYYSALKCEIIETHGLYIGKEIDKNEFDELVMFSERDSAIDKLYTYITKAMKTYNECKKYLYDKGFHTKVVQEALNTACGYGYINDTNYAKLYIEYNERTKGRYRLTQELKLKGIDEAIIKEIYEEREDSSNDEENAYYVAKKYIKSKELDQKNIDKLIRHLYSRGYSWDIIGTVIERIKGDIDA